MASFHIVVLNFLREAAGSELAATGQPTRNPKSEIRNPKEIRNPNEIGDEIFRISDIQKRQNGQPHSTTLARGPHTPRFWRSFWSAPVFSGALGCVTSPWARQITAP